MVCIDGVARGQGGGVWNVADSLPEIDDPAIAIEAKEDVSLPPAKKFKPSGKYLCTGYDAYVTMEPCLM